MNNAGGGIGRRAGSKRGAHNGLQLMGIADMTAERAMCGDKSTPGILDHKKREVKETWEGTQ